MQKHHFGLYTFRIIFFDLIQIYAGHVHFQGVAQKCEIINKQIKILENFVDFHVGYRKFLKFF